MTTAKNQNMSIESASQQHSVERLPRTSHGNGPSSATGLRSKSLRGKPAIEPPQAVFHRPPNGSAPPPWTRWAGVRTLGAHGRTTSETGYPLDRTQHDLAGGLVAENAALTRTRLRYDGQMTLDIRSMPFPNVSTCAGFGVARKGLVSCLRLETTDVRPGAVAVSSNGREGRPRRR